MIPPTDDNFKLYEEWILSGKQGDVFFGDSVQKCGKIILDAGNTLFIPRLADVSHACMMIIIIIFPVVGSTLSTHRRTASCLVETSCTVSP